MCDQWYDPRDSDDVNMIGYMLMDHSPMNSSERAWSPMDYHELCKHTPHISAWLMAWL